MPKRLQRCFTTIKCYPYLNKLSKKYNVVLYLFYYEGYSTKEMAELLHIKENNVRVLLNRARNQLRKEIEADEK